MSSKIFLSATWEYLAMFNYEVDPAILKPHLPPFTEIDYFEGKAIVSIVGFLFNNTKVMGVKWPGFVNFEEVNLRYYIKYFDGTVWKRGVGFISEIVPSKIIATMANVLYNEHYSTAKMSHVLEIKDDLIHVQYNWQKKAGSVNQMEITAENIAQKIIPHSEEEFILEHYYGYNKLNETTTIEYSLAHPTWEVYPILKHKLDCNVEELYGAAFVPFIQNIQPLSVMLAEGSAVNVVMPKKLKQ
jgi:uncharacterized protein